ncbi:MAG TPA: peroxiredoxin [Methyloprofundus sp.]|uniref:peroxiredoxin n=1 Tax=Methyloprofundus sp. TaxID=2020875 RepID=UPI0018545ACD|nr:peroxiredoxin [Methyloprofundus sp.]HIG64257.1 peroxiredoxin [Methyloprofundus sp.]HIL79019.1 peroxiredoxin [Methylococcales bacterium]
MLEINQTAPNFALYDAHENLQQLTDFQNYWLVIYFYPKDNTPGCTKEACALRDDNEEFSKLNTKVIGISTNNSESHLNFSEQQSLPFTLLADPEGTVSAAYGSLFKLGPIKFCKRHSFIIDPAGKIAKIYRSVSPSLHSQELLQDLQSLQQPYSKNE